MKKIIALSIAAMMSAGLSAQSFDFDMTKEQPEYSDEAGYGYDLIAAPKKKEVKPYFFSVKVPDGNYKVTVTIGSKSRKANTTVRAESRRLYVEPTDTKKKEFKTYSFVVSKRSPRIDDKTSVKLKPREKDKDNFSWDDKLTIEINGSAPAVKNIKIERDDNARTIFLCGNSTVTDQNSEPYASWGQMITRWFGDNVAICNVAESGLTATSFLYQNRLDKILSMMKEGDYVFCEFGHNDEKEKAPGSGPWFNYTYALKKYIDLVREKGGNIVFCTPTQRRRFENGKIVSSHGEYPAAMKLTAEKCNVPLIDLTQMTTTFYEALGEENSKKSLVHYAMGTFPNQKKELADNTHFNTWGAYEVAKMVVMGMKKLQLPVVKELKSDWTDYDPAHPDDFNKFVWPLSAKLDVTKPDGN